MGSDGRRMHLALTSALARFGGLNIIAPKEVEYIVESKWVSIGIQADVFGTMGYAWSLDPIITSPLPGEVVRKQYLTKGL